jgi:hypothetical protein
MTKLIDNILGTVEGKPFKVKVVCKDLNGENRFLLEYKRTRFSKWRTILNIDSTPVSYETYLEAAAGAYMASITSLKFFNN